MASQNCNGHRKARRLFHFLLLPEGKALLLDGASPRAAAVFEMDMETLRRLDRGELNLWTALGRARMRDPAPVNMRFPPEFRWTAEARGLYLPLAFHFWNREWPETILFNGKVSRRVHGGNVVVFYYDRGLRTAWYQVKAGMHLNADPADQVNEFPTLVIVTRGSFSGRFNGVERRLREGEAVFIPAGMRHEFWAGPDEYGEFVIVMFGDRA